jgi:hypothetical protein
VSGQARGVWVVAVLLGVVVGGCGGGGGKKATTAHHSTKSKAKQAFTVECLKAQTQALTIAADAGQLAVPNPPSTATNKAVVDADNLKTSLSELKAETPSVSTRIQIDQYISVMDRFQQAVQAEASGDLQAAAAQLTGIGGEFQQVLNGLNSLCKS